MHRALAISLACLLLAAFPVPTFAGTAADEDAVRAAVLDYVEGVYDAKPARIERSVHPELAKRGFGRWATADPYREIPMTFKGLVELAANYAKEVYIPDDAPKDVIVYEVLDQTASIKLIAEWGIDYMHLAKYDGRWMIVNVLWQSHPTEE